MVNNLNSRFVLSDTKSVMNIEALKQITLILCIYE